MLRSLVLASLVAPAALSAQKPWKDVGATATGNHVYVDPRSIKRAGDQVSAAVRVVFKEPVQTPKGAWKSSRTLTTFDCTKRYVAAKENAYFSDVAGTKVVERKVNKQPGFGPVLGGSPGAVAIAYLCGDKR